jgi:hypothetical protein
MATQRFPADYHRIPKHDTNNIDWDIQQIRSISNRWLDYLEQKFQYAASVTPRRASRIRTSNIVLTGVPDGGGARMRGR